jgi:hypothetical protein
MSCAASLLYKEDHQPNDEEAVPLLFDTIDRLAGRDHRRRKRSLTYAVFDTFILQIHPLSHKKKQ